MSFQRRLFKDGTLNGSFSSQPPLLPSNTTSSCPALGGEGRKRRRVVEPPSGNPRPRACPEGPASSQGARRRCVEPGLRGHAVCAGLDLPAPARRAGVVNHKLVPHWFGSQPRVLQKVPWSPCHTGQRGVERGVRRAQASRSVQVRAHVRGERDASCWRNRPREHSLEVPDSFCFLPYALCFRFSTEIKHV